MTDFATAIAAALLISTAAAQATAEPTKIAVMPTKLEESAQGKVPELFDDYVMTAVQNISGAEVIGQDDISTLLSFEEQKDLLNCDDASCIADIGGALGVDKLVAVSVAWLDDSWAVTTKLINLRKTRVEARATRVVEGKVKALLLAVEPLVRELFGVKGPVAAHAPVPSAKPSPRPSFRPKRPPPQIEPDAEPSYRGRFSVGGRVGIGASASGVTFGYHIIDMIEVVATGGANVGSTLRYGTVLRVYPFNSTGTLRPMLQAGVDYWTYTGSSSLASYAPSVMLAVVAGAGMELLLAKHLRIGANAELFMPIDGYEVVGFSSDVGWMF